MTVREAAEARGIRTFDGALPQGYVDDVREKFGEDVRGHFVMSYDVSGGWPAPITPEGDRIEARLVAEGFQTYPYHMLG